MATTPDPRSAASAFLAAVLDRRERLDDVLAEAYAEGGRYARLDRRDRAFARLLASTVLRRLGEIDRTVDALLDRPLPERLTRVRHALRLGAAQLLFLDTPPHAAVDRTVRLVGRDSPFKGLVNAVLRRLARDRDGLPGARDPGPLNTPAWLWASWRAAFGEPRSREIARAHATEPPLDLSVKSDAGEWARRLGAEVLPTGSLRRRDGGPVEGLPGYSEGHWWPQDAAAAVPARILLSSPRGNPADVRILDACAAPGGKTAQLAAGGAVVDALDVSAARLRTLRGNLRRLDLKARIVEGDLRAWTPERPYEAILVDAPCTATGTIRRHPDVPHLRQPTDVARLAGLQGQLLAAAADLLAPGGILVYSVCSLQPEEGVEQVERLLSSRRDLERWPVERTDVAGLEHSVLPAGDVQTLPCHLADAGGVDGFFVARLKRRLPPPR